MMPTAFLAAAIKHAPDIPAHNRNFMARVLSMFQVSYALRTFIY